MEAHVLLGAENLLVASSRMQAAAADFMRAVETLQFEHLRHEGEMRRIVEEFAQAVVLMNPHAGMACMAAGKERGDG